MLNILLFLFDLISKHVIWLYVACIAVILFYIRAYALAHRDRTNTIFTIEKEVAAHREGRAMSGIGMMLGLIVIITALHYYLVPSIDVTALVEPTPTLTLPAPTFPQPTAAATLAPTTAPEAGVPTATPRTQPTLLPTQAAPEPPTPPPPRSACADPNVCIASPGMGATVAGRVAIRGTANHGQFQFYKVEYSLGEEPSGWHVIGDVHRQPIGGGTLTELDTAGLPNGPCWIQLTVVDQSGNFPPPYRVRVTISN